AVVISAGLLFILSRIGPLNNYMVSQFGPLADWYSNNQDSFLRWLLYFSPYSRILEFLAGCFVGHLFLLCRARGYGLYPAGWSSFIAISAVVLILITHVIIFVPWTVGLPNWVQQFHMNFGYAIGVMVLLFCVASTSSGVERFLASRVVVLGGNISYSIYLLH